MPFGPAAIFYCELARLSDEVPQRESRTLPPISPSVKAGALAAAGAQSVSGARTQGVKKPAAIP